MNYDLAMMALEGMARAPIGIRAAGGDVTIEASAASFKELARLCLLLGGVQTDAEEFELKPGVHVSKDSPVLRLKVVPQVS
jgi:hypothetical protein